MTLAFCFQALRPSNNPALASTLDHLAIIRRDLILKRAVLVGIYKQVLANVKRGIQADRVTFVDGLAARVERAVGIADLREVALALRCFRGSNSRRRANTHLKPMPALLLPSGTMAANFKEVREEFQRHFALLEAGAVTSVQQVATQCGQRQQDLI